MAEHVVHRRLEVRVAEAFDDNPVDMRNLSVDRMRTINAHYGSDPNRAIE
jgi:hypothetical protein